MARDYAGPHGFDPMTWLQALDAPSLWLFGGLGFIFLLLGAIGDVYPTTTGVIIMFACWLVAGVLAK